MRSKRAVPIPWASRLPVGARLHRVDDRAGVEGLHAVQDADLPGYTMHRDAKTMG